MICPMLSIVHPPYIIIYLYIQLYPHASLHEETFHAPHGQPGFGFVELFMGHGFQFAKP